jgi:F-type H+-transporting ATPase subunit gamma
MPNLKEVRTRISSVNSTKQITSAMKMVAASKLRKAQDAILKMRPYANKLSEILHDLSASLGDNDDNIYANEREVKSVLLVILTSNRGLCGAFNANVIKFANQQIKEKYSNLSDDQIKIMVIGKKAFDYFKNKNYEIVERHDDLYNELNFENTVKVAEKVMREYREEKYDKVEIIYNKFKNAATQVLSCEQFLPVKIETSEDEVFVNTDYIFQPNKIEIVNQVIPKTLKIQFYKTLLDTFAAEHGARMTAMHQATDNADSLLKELKLSYNKARQAAITNEIIEIVGGAEALKD